MRHSGIQEFTCFTPSAFSPGNHHSRSLEGKYTFPVRDLLVLGQGGQNR